MSGEQLTRNKVYQLQTILLYLQSLSQSEGLLKLRKYNNVQVSKQTETNKSCNYNLGTTTTMLTLSGLVEAARKLGEASFTLHTIDTLYT